MWSRRTLLALLGIVAVSTQGGAAWAQASPFTWVTLGTMGGPTPSAERSQPANLLIRPGEAHLIDAGDAAATRMIMAGAQFSWLQSIFISHIHFDHIGGLGAVLGLRNQTRTTTPLTIYGPPGIKTIVAGLLASMEPSAQSGFGVPGETPVAPGAAITVVELRDGSTAKAGDVRVKAAANTHYSFASSSPQAQRFVSLSFRFDLPGRSIAYTGDTGPSAAVEKLARGADLLVSEMIDLPSSLQGLRRQGANLSPDELKQITKHLAAHHLTSDQVGQLARRAEVGKVIVTHLAGGGAADPRGAARYVDEIQRRFPGPVIIAKDMDRF